MRLWLLFACTHTTHPQVGRFGITGSAQTLKIKHLSDGLKSRVVFSWLAERRPHMLLLGGSKHGSKAAVSC